MCGIAVVISEGGEEAGTAPLVDEVLLARRGPDHLSVVEVRHGSLCICNTELVRD